MRTPRSGLLPFIDGRPLGLVDLPGPRLIERERLMDALRLKARDGLLDRVRSPGPMLPVLCRLIVVASWLLDLLGATRRGLALRPRFILYVGNERGGKRRNGFNLVSCDGIHKKKNMK